MKKKLEDFSPEDCEIVFNSILSNKKHTDKDKTLSFLNELKTIEEKNIDKILNEAETYFYKIKHFLNFDKDEKMFFLATEVKKFDSSELTCCLQVVNPEDISNIIEHSLSVEHFIGTSKIDEKISDSIKTISDYFFATGNVNIKEIYLIYKLIKENKYFKELIKK